MYTPPGEEWKAALQSLLEEEQTKGQTPQKPQHPRGSNSKSWNIGATDRSPDPKERKSK